MTCRNWPASTPRCVLKVLRFGPMVAWVTTVVHALHDACFIRNWLALLRLINWRTRDPCVHLHLLSSKVA